MSEIERVSMATFEAQAERSAKLIRWIILGWAVSVVMLGFVVITMASYEDEIVTTTTSEISQDSQDNGSNVYAGGDYYGNANDQGYDYDGEDEAQGSGDPETGVQ